MDRKIFIEKLFARAAEMGMTDCEVYYASGSSFDTAVFKGEVVSYNAADTMGLGFRALVNGKMGYSSTQALDESAIDLLVNSAKTNAELIDSEDEQFLYAGGGEYAEVDACDINVEKVTEAEKIALAKEMERKTLAADSRIDQVEGCEVFSESGECAIVNTKGLNVSAKSSCMGGYIAAVARQGEKVSSGVGIFIGEGADRAISEAVGAAVDYLDAETMPSGEYPVIFRYDAMSSLLATFSSVFSADAAQKGLSLFKGREGDTVAAECVTIADDPHMKSSASSSPFDGEGAPTYYKEPVKAGVLTTLLHNLKTAHKQNVKTTGNAARGSYSSPVGVSPSNFYIKPGEATFDKIVKRAGDGVVICELQGLHAGANAVSGDFSLSAKGYRVEGGKISGAVRQITVAGNFYEVLKNITAVANDLRMGIPGAARFGSPSVLVSKLSIAGK